MEGQDLLDKLNGYPMWVDLDPPTRSDAFGAVSELGDTFQRATPESRRLISGALGRSAKYVMSQFSRDKAVEGVRNRSRTAIVEGLIPVAMAGGRSDNFTGGSLLSMLFHSAEKSGLDAEEAFAYAAQFATDEESATQIREFPRLPPKMRSIERFGFHERKTPDGVTYEQMVEAMGRPRWWDRLIGRRRVTREDTLRTMREFERTWASDKKSESR